MMVGTGGPIGAVIGGLAMMAVPALSALGIIPTWGAANASILGAGTAAGTLAKAPEYYL